MQVKHKGVFLLEQKIDPTLPRGCTIGNQEERREKRFWFYLCAQEMSKTNNQAPLYIVCRKLGDKDIPKGSLSPYSADHNQEGF